MRVGILFRHIHEEVIGPNHVMSDTSRAKVSSTAEQLTTGKLLYTASFFVTREGGGRGRLRTICTYREGSTLEQAHHSTYSAVTSSTH